MANSSRPYMIPFLAATVLALVSGGCGKAPENPPVAKAPEVPPVAEQMAKTYGLGGSSDEVRGRVAPVLPKWFASVSADQPALYYAPGADAGWDARIMGWLNLLAV